MIICWAHQQTSRGAVTAKETAETTDNAIHEDHQHRQRVTVEKMRISSSQNFIRNAQHTYLVIYVALHHLFDR